MIPEIDLNVFLNPKSVAIVGATERPGAWMKLADNVLAVSDGSPVEF